MKNDVIKYYNLLEQIQGLVQKSKAQVQRNVNTIIVQTYWQIGYYIVEYEQKGSERAEYGTTLLRNLSQDLTEQFGRGYSYRNLQLAKKFYNTFPIVQSLVAQSSEKKLTPIEKALLNCSWTHLVRLLSIKDETERHFYLIETVASNWSVRDLNRQIDSALFERLLLNKNISTVKQIATQKEVTAMDNVLKDPYVLEFLGFEEQNSFSENELETAIINNLEKFLLELGKGFSFVARQYRISSGADHFYIDLVFYNRLLKSHILIDLKIGKLKHQDIGQMQMYVNYFDREIKLKDEKPTIGIILCKEKNDFVVEYSLPKENQQIYSKEYLLYLPQKEELKKMLESINIK